MAGTSVSLAMAILVCSIGSPVESCAQSFSGSGDAIVDFTRPSTPAIVHITGDAGNDYFVIRSSTPGGGYDVDLLVDAAGPYDGIRPLDFEGTHAGRFAVTAITAWTIDILPVSSAHSLPVPGSYAGIGDDVLALSGAMPDTATISGNAAGGNFAIDCYRAAGELIGRLVDTTNPFVGSVSVPHEAVYLVIEAVGPWSISTTGIYGPTISQIKSKKSTAGSPVSVYGTGFSAKSSSNIVRFGTKKATVTKASPTKLTVTIPTSCRKGRSYDVTVTVNSISSNSLPFAVK
ncbi:MAG: IPT/TIG domain-containing protein [Acidobacteria bacterium]|nr:IPT/TIG domain-containing protein [Acidobacteriota bacterium]